MLVHEQPISRVFAYEGAREENSVIQALLLIADLKQKQQTDQGLCLLNGCYHNVQSEFTKTHRNELGN